MQMVDATVIRACLGKIRSRFIYSYLSAPFSVYFEKLIPFSLTLISIESS